MKLVVVVNCTVSYAISVSYLTYVSSWDVIVCASGCAAKLHQCIMGLNIWSCLYNLSNAFNWEGQNLYCKITVRLLGSCVVENFMTNHFFCIPTKCT
jgi:hypothetical protein